MVCDHAYEMKNAQPDVQLDSHCLQFSNFRFEYQVLRLLRCFLELNKVSWQKIWKNLLDKYNLKKHQTGEKNKDKYFASEDGKLVPLL